MTIIIEKSKFNYYIYIFKIHSYKNIEISFILYARKILKSYDIVKSKSIIYLIWN